MAILDINHDHVEGCVICGVDLPEKSLKPGKQDFLSALQHVTPEDLKTLDKQIEQITMQREELIRVRKMVLSYMRAMGIDPGNRPILRDPGRPRGALAKSQRMAIVKLIAKMGRSVQQKEIESDLGIASGSITYLTTYKWFRKDEFGRVSITTEARREVL